MDKLFEMHMQAECTCMHGWKNWTICAYYADDEIYAMQTECIVYT